MPPQHLPNNALRRCPGVHSLLNMKEGEGACPASSSCWWVCTHKGLVAVTRQELLSEVRRTFKVSADKVDKHSRHVIEKKDPRLAVRVEVPRAFNLRLKSSLLGVAGVQCCVEGSRSSFVSSLVDAVNNPVWNMECLIDVLNVQEEELRIVVRQETDMTSAGKRLTNQIFRGIGKVAQTYTAAQTYSQLNPSTKTQVFQKEEEEEEDDDLSSFSAGTTSTLPTPLAAQKAVKWRNSKSLAGSLLTMATAGKMALGKDVAKVGISSYIIGDVKLPLKELTELGTSGVFSLSKHAEDKAGKNKTKKSSKGDLKRRGEVEVRLTMTCRENKIIYPGGTLRGLQVLLEKVLRLHFSRHSSEGESDSTRNTGSDQDLVEPQPFDQGPRPPKDPCQEAWSGDLPAGLQALVTMYAYVGSANPCDLSLAWLCVCTKMPSWDATRTSWSAEETTSIQSSNDDDDDDDWSSKWPEKQYAAMWKPPRSSVMCQSMMSVMNCSMMLLTDLPDKHKASMGFEKVPLLRPSKNLGENSRVNLVKNGDNFLLTINNHARARESADSGTALNDAKESTDDDSKKTVEESEVSRINSVPQSRMTYVDASFLGQLFYEIQQYLEEDVFTEQQLKELRSSTVAWRRRTRRQLCRLTSSFPSSAGVVAAKQLACTLSIYNQLETHPKTSLLLEDDCTLTEVISESARHWWRSVTPCVVRTAEGPDAVLEEVLRVSKEALRFLNNAALFYDPIFSEHLSRSYSEIVYEEAVGKVMENVSSFLMTLDLRRTPETTQTEIDAMSGRRKRATKTRRKPLRWGHHDGDDEEDGRDAEAKDGGDDTCHFSIVNTNPAWQLYTTLGQLYRFGETLNTLDVTQTPISAYHALFVPWQKAWLTSLAQHMGELLPYEVTRDTFEKMNFEDISASASDMEHNLVLLRDCWLRLELPEGSPKVQLLLKVLRKMSDLATLYSDLVCQTLDVWVTRDGNGHIQLTKEVCIGLNNIAYTRRSLSTHMQYLLRTINTNDNSGTVDKVLSQEEAKGTEGGEASNLFLRIADETSTLTSSNPSPKSCLASSNDNTLDTSRMSSSAFSSTSQRAQQVAQEMVHADARMRKKEEKYVSTMVNKLRGSLRKAVTQSCLQKSGSSLLQVLEPIKNLLMEGVRGEDQCVLVKLRLWKILLDLFQDVIRNSSKRGHPEFYHDVLNVVQEILPSYIENGAISTNDVTSFPEYQSLMQELNALRRSTSSVIESYYRQRASDRTRIVEAVLDVRMGLTISHRLRIHVAMLSSLRQFSTQSLPPTPHFSTSSSTFPYVCIKIRLVPSAFFKKSRIVRTKNLSWKKFVVFDESFSLDDTLSEPNQGLVLFSLVLSYGRRSSIVVAEGVVPLDLIFTSEESSTLPNYRMKLTRPGPIDDYESLRILEQRKEDTVARKFLATQLQLRKKPSPNSFLSLCNVCNIL